MSCMDKSGLAGAHGATGGSEKQTVRKVFRRHPGHVGKDISVFGRFVLYSGSAVSAEQRNLLKVGLSTPSVTPLF